MLVIQNNNSRPSVWFALRTKLDMGFIPAPSSFPTPNVNPPECCVQGIDSLPVFGDANSDNPNNNDFSGFLQTRTLPSEDWAFTLEKFNTGAWVQVDTLNGSSDNCLFSDWATYGNSVPLKGVRVLWKNVLINFEEGIYRIVATKTGYGAIIWYSQTYCLRQFTLVESDTTTRFDWYLNGPQNSIYDKTVRVNYGTINWFDSIRIPGCFGYETSETQRTEVRYETGLLQNIKDDVAVKYKWKSGLLNYRTHEYLAYNAFLSNALYATDYCLLNDNPTYQNVPIKYDSGYSPKFLTYNINSDVEIDFKNRSQNTGRQIC